MCWSRNTERKAGNEMHPSRETAVPSRQGLLRKEGVAGGDSEKMPAKAPGLGSSIWASAAASRGCRASGCVRRERQENPLNFFSCWECWLQPPGKQDQAAQGSRQSRGAEAGLSTASQRWQLFTDCPSQAPRMTYF